MERKKTNKTKIVIIVLSVLLALSLVALAGTLIHNKISSKPNTSVAVPDNLITPDDNNGNNTSENSSSSENTDISSAVTTNGNAQNTKKATSISLYNKQPQDNTAFAVGNMFPGDSETKYYCVQVSYHDKVTVHFGADVRKGYEKLAEVMKVEIKLLDTNEVLYDGLMRDMPESVTYKLTSYESTTDELYYKINAYLDTSVGNEYQNQDLIADFNWWVEETGNLDKAPQTGDGLTLALLIVFAFILTVLGTVLLVIFKKEDTQNDR